MNRILPLSVCSGPALGLLTAIAIQIPQRASGAESEVELPPGVSAQWDLEKAFRETTPIRERICINGLWRWQPGTATTTSVPTGAWGFFKVPAPWPGIQDYMQSDYQTLYSHPEWKNTALATVRSAWYQRTISIPANWAGGRIGLATEYLNSFAAVYVDGKEAGQIRFPAGEVDLTSIVRPGSNHVLTLQVSAMPLKAVMESYTDSNAARQRQGTVERRGLCGDVWLIKEPKGPRLGEARIDTSVRQKRVTFHTRVQALPEVGEFKLQARIRENGAELASFTGPPFSSRELTNSRSSFSASWLPEKLWDLHTSSNQFTAEVSLIGPDGRTLDTAFPVRFGFRELWTEGRDFYLNGSRIFLSLVPLDNAQVGAALATYEGARESFRRLRSFGINFVYTHNYGCEPGSHLSFEDILRAADDTGMLVALSQPHFSAYDWKSEEADRTNGYAAHAEFYVRVAGSHPSVVSYSMSHNATGYNEDMNPQMIGMAGYTRDQWSARNAATALRCERIVRQLDPARLLYHHSSGSLSGMYTVNFYPNFVPIQEMDDWFENWSKAGTEPVLLVEYGAPFGWDWTMYRGWFDGKREFGSADVPWEYCLAEWNAQFQGDSAYRISEREKRNLRWEAQQFRQKRGWRRWDYPTPVGDKRLDEVHPVQTAYTTSNWRSFRTWGLSGNSPWEHDRFWKLRDNFQPRHQELAVEWESLQRPGYSPDFVERTYARFDLAYGTSDWIASPTAEALRRNNMPRLAWLAGKPQDFTSKEHIFHAGERIQKQLIVINNSRVTASCEAAWSCEAGRGFKGTQRVEIPTGEQARLPIEFALPADLAPGKYELRCRVDFTDGERQEDIFGFTVIPRPQPLRPRARMALFDPPGQSGKLLADLGVKAEVIGATADLAGFDVLLIGKGALGLDNVVPDLNRVRDGLKVVVFEQTGEVLEKRLGLRVAEYGLRQLWPRVPDNAALAGLNAETLRDWRGAATLLPPALKYELSRKYNGAPSVQWCGLEVPRLWRCGNRGSVASVSIEKPCVGNFLPILEGGYALQYSPLLEYREGRGMVLFCQVDVTGRTEKEPAATTLARNLLQYVEGWQPAAERTVLYAGEAAGRSWLKEIGIEPIPFTEQQAADGQVLVVAPGAGSEPGAANGKVSDWIRGGGQLLALGLDDGELKQLLPVPITTDKAEHIACWFPSFDSSSPLAGVSPADLHNRDPRAVPLVNAGATVFGNGVLAVTGRVVICQLRPWDFERTPERFNQRRTFGRTSYAVNRILANLGVSGSTPLLDRFRSPAASNKQQGSAQGSAGVAAESDRWVQGFYLTKPTEWDDPYRFFRW